jgi:hypothetical protein
MLAAAGPRKPSLAAFCPPKCPPSDLLSSGPTEQDSVTARKFDIRALHATQYNREPSRSVTTVWSACQAATPVSATRWPTSGSLWDGTQTPTSDVSPNRERRQQGQTPGAGSQVAMERLTLGEVAVQWRLRDAGTGSSWNCT